jgi:TetR/AcrR family transcriptional regulator, regulator of cefoperazone and chloramphenicol sensitivity
MADPDPTRRRILEAAGPLFAAAGFDATSVRDITQAAATNVAAVNYHFRSKEDLYVETVRLAAESCNDLTPLPVWEQDVPAEQKLRDFLRAFLTRILRDDVPEWHRLLIMRELAQPHGEACEVFVENFVKPCFTMLMSIFEELLPAHVTAEERHLIGGSIVGQILHHHHARNIIPLLVGPREYRGYTIERLTEHIWRFSLAALRGLYPVKEKGDRR